MAEPFIGQVIITPYNFAPRGYAQCDGQLMSIAQNTALFSLLGTTYGGNGQTNFQLPDLRSRAPIHYGQGPGLSFHDLGESGGQESVQLTTGQLPAHTHGTGASTSEQSTDLPGGNVPAVGGAYAAPGDGPTAGGPTTPAGGGLPHNNMSPFLALNFCIALQGIFPSRN